VCAKVVFAITTCWACTGAQGETNRVIGEHQLNRESSRSHSIFTITLELRPLDEVRAAAAGSAAGTAEGSASRQCMERASFCGAPCPWLGPRGSVLDLRHRRCPAQFAGGETLVSKLALVDLAGRWEGRGGRCGSPHLLLSRAQRAQGQAHGLGCRMRKQGPERPCDMLLPLCYRLDSERVSKTKSEGVVLREAGHINKVCLTCL
jgi:hypothetical protein